MEHVWWRGEVDAMVLWGNLRERDHLKDLGIAGRVLFKAQDRDRWQRVVGQRLNLAEDGTGGMLL
jgi:hypothetical protein